MKTIFYAATLFLVPALTRAQLAESSSGGPFEEMIRNLLEFYSKVVFLL